IYVTVNSSKLHVTGASGQTLYIYNVAGVCVMSMKIDGADREYDLSLTKGCYIVKVGKTVRKIFIK
ncbi:MAG: T9SS type A sorting domain-containing protein, partial [Prevotella sp.]|nr:T9SS type A sorting domain-containing protein [Prevotella sp.]